jgi:hypothetical protein
MKTRRFSAAWVLWLAACGPSAARVKEAQNSVYNAPFSEVWTSVTDELRRFQAMDIEDAINGQARTGWRLIDRGTNEGSAAGTDPSQTQVQSQPGQSQSGNQSTGQGAGPVTTNPGMTTYAPGGFYMRLMARVKGPPWKIDIDGEAGEHRPGYAELIRYRHGVADEPAWVEARIENVRVAVHERLRQYAVVKEAPAPPKPKAPEETPWGTLPDAAKGAIDVLTAVHKAARDRKAVELRPDLAPEVTWSAGAPPSADVALAMWSADPEVLSTMARTLEGGCGYLEKEDAIVCPAGAPIDAQPGPHAVFRRPSGDWKLVLFIGR